MDGQEIALRMIQVAEAASMAAQSAAEALGRRPEGDKNWFRVLPKPANFDAKTREEEMSQWRDFSWSVEQYLSSMDGAFAEDFKEVRGLTRWEHIPLLAVGFRQTASIALRPIDCSSRALNLPRRTGH